MMVKKKIVATNQFVDISVAAVWLEPHGWNLSAESLAPLKRLTCWEGDQTKVALRLPTGRRAADSGRLMHLVLISWQGCADFTFILFPSADSSCIKQEI